MLETVFTSTCIFSDWPCRGHNLFNQEEVSCDPSPLPQYVKGYLSVCSLSLLAGLSWAHRYMGSTPSWVLSPHRSFSFPFTQQLSNSMIFMLAIPYGLPTCLSSFSLILAVKWHEAILIKTKHYGCFFRRVGKGQEKYICATESISRNARTFFLLYIITEKNLCYFLQLIKQTNENKLTEIPH